MPIHETEGVVLRHYSLSEADRIIVLFTRDFGKVRAVARGTKRPKSRIAGSLEPLTHIQLQFYSKEGSELAYVRQAETIHSYLSKHPSIKHLYAFTYLAELVQEFVDEYSPNQLLFRLLLSTLHAGESHEPTQALIRYFEIWTLRLNGLFSKYDSCSNCGLCVKDDGFFVWPETGQAHCISCAGGRGIHIHPSTANVLQKIFELSPEEFSQRPLGEEAADDIEYLAQRLLQFHLEKQLKSYSALRDILRGS
jgi:DNA repair protein RecO (recombination protein O)